MVDLCKLIVLEAREVYKGKSGKKILIPISHGCQSPEIRWTNYNKYYRTSKAVA
jgi:hypothetical protein